MKTRPHQEARVVVRVLTSACRSLISCCFYLMPLNGVFIFKLLFVRNYPFYPFSLALLVRLFVFANKFYLCGIYFAFTNSMIINNFDIYIFFNVNV
jgi:hypothetical protein